MRKCGANCPVRYSSPSVLTGTCLVVHTQSKHLQFFSDPWGDMYWKLIVTFDFVRRFLIAFLSIIRELVEFSLKQLGCKLKKKTRRCRRVGIARAHMPTQHCNRTDFGTTQTAEEFFSAIGRQTAPRQPRTNRCRQRSPSPPSYRQAQRHVRSRSPSRTRSRQATQSPRPSGIFYSD